MFLSSPHKGAEPHPSKLTSYESGDGTKPSLGQACQSLGDMEKAGDFTLMLRMQICFENYLSELTH